ncbi:MAG: Grx4 family monothiol glutaredoxin [Myxococcota bacterium]|nr:Grx4 family monothiol glutaredoxin [Myxococcota bacterium]
MISPRAAMARQAAYNARHHPASKSREFEAVGIIKRIKKRLPIIGGSRDSGAVSRPSASFSSTSRPAPPSEPPPPPPPPKSAEEVQAEIEGDVKANKVLLFMKGSPRAPQCGFSAAVADILNRMEVPYETRDVIANPEIRQGVKDYTDWPTLPQLFVNHEFVGGCDIVREMEENGELRQLLDEAFSEA